MTTDPTPAATARDALLAEPFIRRTFPDDVNGIAGRGNLQWLRQWLDNLIALAAAEAPGRVAALEAALRSIVSELERFWEHGEDCPVWATDDVTDEPMYPGDIPARHEACDCGIAVLLGKADAALAVPAPTPSEPVAR